MGRVPLPPGARFGESLRALRALPCSAILVALLGAGCGEKPAPPAPESIVSVRRPQPAGDARSTPAPSYIAIVRADNEIDLSFKVPGVIERVGPTPQQDWQEGQFVQRATRLARLNQGDFTNAVNSARARAELDRSLVKRNRQLREEGAISLQEMETLEANLRSSEAGLQQALQNLADSELLAPTNGTILERRVKAGETVAAGQPVLRIGDLSRVSVELGVPDRSIRRFNVGDTVKVRFSALEGMLPFEGQVTEVGVAAREDARLFKVIIKVPNPGGTIKAGMTALVPVGDAPTAKPGEVTIPLSALVGAPGDRTGRELAVFVVEDSRQPFQARLRPVKTRDIIESSIVVSEGLTTNDSVVVLGAGSLHDGARVTIQPERPAASP